MKTLRIYISVVVALASALCVGRIVFLPRPLESRAGLWKVSVESAATTISPMHWWWGAQMEDGPALAVVGMSIVRGASRVDVPASAWGGLAGVRTLGIVPTKAGCVVRLRGGDAGTAFGCTIRVAGMRVVERSVVSDEMGKDLSESTVYRYVPDRGQ